MKLCSLAVLVAFGTIALFPVAAALANPDYIVKAVADVSRPPDDRKSDSVRKPAEVLAFAGVKPGQRVAEYLPGGGYYTRMLSDAVGFTRQSLCARDHHLGQRECRKYEIRVEGTFEYRA